MNNCPFCGQKYHPNMVRHVCAAMITALVMALAEIRLDEAKPGGRGILVKKIDRTLDKAREVKGYEHL